MMLRVTPDCLLAVSQSGVTTLRSLLRNAAQAISRTHRQKPVWWMVSQVLGIGSTSAREVCKECGWDPNEMLCKF